MMRLLAGAVVLGLLLGGGFVAAPLALVLARRFAPRKKVMLDRSWTEDDGDVKRPIFLSHAHNY
ncbi:MAG: hypothetical protein ABSA39_05230 [Edaphobacter sp.]